jgi:hypothetical protein
VKDRIYEGYEVIERIRSQDPNRYLFRSNNCKRR